MIVSGTLSCGLRPDTLQEQFDRANGLFLRGELVQSQSAAHQAYERCLKSNPDWAWRFRIIEAKAALWRGLYGEVEEILKSIPDSARSTDGAISKLTLLGIARTRTHDFAEARRLLHSAELKCGNSILESCGYLIQAQGLLASETGQSDSAEGHYRSSLAFARAHGDRFLEANSLLNLGAESLSLGHYDEAIDRSQAAHDIAERQGAKIPELVTQGNLAWAYYRLGDRERALELAKGALRAATELGNVYEQGNQFTNLGYMYFDDRRLGAASDSFQQALVLAEKINAKLHVYETLRVLARLALQAENINEAAQRAQHALDIARESGVHADELYPRLVQGQISAKRGDAAEAEKTFLEVEGDPACPVFLKWEAEHSLAQLFENQVSDVRSQVSGKAPRGPTRLANRSVGPAKNAQEQADRYYRLAIATFEGARASVRRQSSQLSFLTNGWAIYDDYVHFLVERGRTDEALRWADYSRARTLAEGLGVLPPKTAAQPPPLRAQEIARAVNGTLLFYWLGEKQSYQWAISPKTTRLFTLPAGQEIEEVAKRYRDAITGPQSASLTSNADGQWLYKTLVAPAQALIAQNARVFVIPDGGLNNLNFDTLVAPTPQPHYWIEDATIANASSLRMLAASYGGSPALSGSGRTRVSAPHKAAPHLLLIGNSIAPNDKYPELPRAAAQMQGVAAHFPAAQERVIAREQATPQAYVNANPEQFSHIHFVAHGTASRLSPLDSAIVLSKSSADSESFKLYARDIIQHPLHADVVTISSCYGAGTRAYSGEGLVGLSWAFLRAGARNVVAALWEATDKPTEQLMTTFYDELNRGAPPDAALRNAKLALLHGGTFSNPVYWAPFQLYTQGRYQVAGSR